ncbi:RdgB/HAM1 family non-canonical purine NTP pyrophosphatase [Thiotrichales bacterium 19S9-12]|nr:RdgB/HAM1 family non-canonical purine NTP pyrophosphatase [Thiotrichales bacterium 19S9-11]MCF6811716.1 RdgB/HAM1 family non-canonical purine NTP pyrophosphatase [Thiotrichales bacterium 19S9-12]
MKKIVFASSNAGKICEMNQILSQFDITLLSQSEFNVADAEETGLTFIENALLKAHHLSEHTDLPVLADDSGLVIDVLNGAPGIFSARYGSHHGDATGGIQRVLNELEGVEENNRSAHFHCSLVLVKFKQDPDPIICQGRWHGHILKEPQGDGGFGYDPIFFDPKHQLSAAELEPKVKNKISHRGQAMAKLIRILKDLS